MTKILKWIIGTIISIVVGLFVAIFVVNTIYGINMVDVYFSLGRLSKNCEITEIAPNAPTQEDYTKTMQDMNNSLNGFVSYNAETQKYSISNAISGTMTQNIKLTGQEVCVLINWFLDNQEQGLLVNIGENNINLKDYDFKIASITFSLNEDNSVNYNVIMSVSLLKIKEKMNSFPLNLLKGKVPDTLYINSIVKVTKKTGVFNYDVTHESLALNKMTGKEVNNLFNLINIVAKIGDIGDFNLALGKSFVDVLIGNSEVSGLAYSLQSVGATDFEFALQDEIVYFIINN